MLGFVTMLFELQNLHSFELYGKDEHARFWNEEIVAYFKIIFRN